MKLELGAGHRPTRGYDYYNDAVPWPGITHVGPAWMIDLPDGSLDEVLALGFVEHLTYYEALDTFRNVHRMLKPGGWFLFDVPNYPAWVAYYLRWIDPTMHLSIEPPVSLEDCRKTLFGWARFPGDEHKFGWDQQLLSATLTDIGFSTPNLPGHPINFQQRTYRDRFLTPENDPHFYVVTVKL